MRVLNNCYPKLRYPSTLDLSLYPMESECQMTWKRVFATRIFRSRCFQTLSYNSQLAGVGNSQLAGVGKRSQKRWSGVSKLTIRHKHTQTFKFSACLMPRGNGKIQYPIWNVIHIKKWYRFATIIFSKWQNSKKSIFNWISDHFISLLQNAIPNQLK